MPRAKLLGVVALGAMLLWLTLWQGGGAQRGPTVADDPSALSSAPPAPVGAREHRDRGQPAVTASPAAPKPAEAVPPDDDPLSPAALERERVQFESYFGDLDAKRRAERVDAAWVDQVRARIGEVMKNEELLEGSSIASVDCAGTLCRVEARHDHVVAKHMFSNVFTLRVGLLLPESTMYSAPGTLTTVAHFAREGTSLPRIQMEPEPTSAPP